MKTETIIRETSIGLGEVRHMWSKRRYLKFEIVYAVGNAIDLRIVTAIDMAGNRNDITEFCFSDNPLAEGLIEAIKDCVKNEQKIK